MKEILGNNLTVGFATLGIDAKLKDKGKRFEVWELSDEEFDRLCLIPEEEWIEEEYGWWRYGKCILEGSPLLQFTINRHPMLGYLGTSVIDDLNEGEESEDVVDKTYFTCEAYESFTHYLSNAMGVSTEKDIACFAISLAKENNLTLAEFMRRYQP